jgi:hypothetical protein
MNTQPSRSQVRPLSVLATNIPDFLKGLDTWTVWKAFAKPKGGFEKKPIHPATGRVVDAQDSANQFSFAEALAAYELGRCDGVGLVLTGVPVTCSTDGEPLYLLGVDFDRVRESDDRTAEVRTLLSGLRGLYVETSPSGNGLRLFGLSREKVYSGSGAGGELYCKGRFLTVTGQNARGTIHEATHAFRALEKRLWPERHAATGNVVPFPRELIEMTRRMAGNQFVEVDEHVEKVRAALSCIPPDSPYDVWRDVIWALASLGWSCGQELAEEWSSGSAAHWQYDGGAEAQHTIASLFDQFQSDRGITIGTLFHHAQERGMPRAERPATPSFLAPLSHAAQPRARFSILSRAELDALPPMRWTIQGVLPETGLVAIFGQPGSAKTFLALDLAARISSGAGQWFGRRVTQRSVVYCALEGGRGIKQRIRAWEVADNTEAEEVRVLLDHFNLRDWSDVEALSAALQAACAPGAVIIIDTLAHAMAGGDENSGQDIGLVLMAAKAIADTVQGLVILVHHSGKDAGRGLRGHSSLNAAMDAVIVVERDRLTDRRGWRVTKMKDADDGATGQFELEVVDLGADGFGGRVTSCVVREVAGPVASTMVPPPTGANQKVVLDALRTDASSAQGWTQSALTELAKTALTDVSSRHRASRAKDAITGLIEGGYLRLGEGGVLHLNPPGSSPPGPLL